MKRLFSILCSAMILSAMASPLIFSAPSNWPTRALRVGKAPAALIGSTRAAVLGPVWSAQRTNRSGVHSAYSRWALGMCAVTVV